MSGEISRRTGEWGEQIAVSYLRRHGWWIRERNYRAGHHEIDVIATRWGVIAFVEVKARSYREADAEIAPPPGNAIRSDKKKFTRQAARQYLSEHPCRHKPRMDVIEIWLKPSDSPKRPKVLRLRHMEGAY